MESVFFFFFLHKRLLLVCSSKSFELLNEKKINVAYVYLGRILVSADTLGEEGLDPIVNKEKKNASSQ